MFCYQVWLAGAGQANGGKGSRGHGWREGARERERSRCCRRLAADQAVTCSLARSMQLSWPQVSVAAIASISPSLAAVLRDCVISACIRMDGGGKGAARSRAAANPVVEEETAVRPSSHRVCRQQVSSRSCCRSPSHKVSSEATDGQREKFVLLRPPSCRQHLAICVLLLSLRVTCCQQPPVRH